MLTSFFVFSDVDIFFKNFQMHLTHQNGKQAQFLVHPRYKVKSEGDMVQEGDQIVLESVKTRGQYLHTSSPYKLDNLVPKGQVFLFIFRPSSTKSVAALWSHVVGDP